ncbi:hypothetical protein AYL99_09657 [Fonsecaea erecta]|uniref:Dienelactone hydrolase domain-containing protein n=1 Tax=Fonsecaea erecta TaxID=1367422 RepID=A0A178Z9L5_9EURO|nr:hypothetical protein AYL99_09657 [Fonsecaea erecta]OAP56478.1 hypothetical protein AYL99_09657 [Fonsecaea erecta]
MIAEHKPWDEVPYTIQSEARRIYETIVSDPRLNLPEEVKRLEDKIQFTGDESDAFFPVPFKAAESQAGLLGYIGLLALAISKDRYGIEQECQIDVAQALLNGLGALFIRHEGEWLSGSPKMMAAVQRWDHGMTRELYRQLATNIYMSKDGRWYSLHGNMNPTPLLEMLNLPQHNEKNLTWPEIIEMYSNVVGDIHSQVLDNWSNNVYRTPGTLCLEKDEFESTPQGRAIKDEPYYNLIAQQHYTQPVVSWDGVHFDPADRRPLSGIKVLDLSRAIAAPTIGRVCAALGATVIRVSCSKNTELPITLIDGCIGKTSVDIDLKSFEGRKKLLELIEEADVFIDGYRPAVMEHLGFGRDAVLGLVASRDRGLVYCQENCYGWKGPWTTRPGWAQIADTVCGIGLDIGRFHGYDEPHIFPGPNADYLTGHAGAAGVLHGLYLRSRQGGSYVVQCSLVVSNMQMQSYGKYTEEQQAALKARNRDLIGKIRHYDEIVSHGRNQNVIRGFIADRGFDKAIKHEYYQKVDGSQYSTIGGVSSYISESQPDSYASKGILLLLPDGFGLAKHNLILADNFAKEGWRVIIPDYFESDPLPIQFLKQDPSLSINEQPWPEEEKQILRDLDFPAWLRRHNHTKVSSLLEGLTSRISSQHPDTAIVGVGYCFGGKHVLRLSKNVLKAAACFHPSFVEAEDMNGIRAPLYIGLAEKDDMVPASLPEDLRRWARSGMKPGVPFKMESFPHMGHGFAARPDTEDASVRAQYQRAFQRTLEHFIKFASD